MPVMLGTLRSLGPLGGKDSADVAANKQAALSTSELVFRREHRQWASQAKPAHASFLAIRKAYHEHFDKVAPRVPSAFPSGALSSWGLVYWGRQNFPAIPACLPKWCHTARFAEGFFARFVLVWAGQLQFSSDAVVLEDPGVTFIELAASTELFTGIRLPVRCREALKPARTKQRHSAKQELAKARVCFQVFEDDVIKQEPKEAKEFCEIVEEFAQNNSGMPPPSLAI